MEAKDLRSNLVLCLERFKAHIDKFSSIIWEEKVFRVFMFGDYEYLSKMYGLSGASGKHPCLWCEIPSEMMSVPHQNEKQSSSRELWDLLRRTWRSFKLSTSQISKKQSLSKMLSIKRFFNVPLTQVCLPGLHITLGVVFKFVQLYEILARDLDFRIAAEIAKANLSISDAESDELVEAYKK